MHEEQALEFVVEVDQDSVARMRARVLREKRTSILLAEVGAGLILLIVLGAALVTGFAGPSWPLTILGLAVGSLCGTYVRQQLVAMRRLRATWAAVGVPTEVMRFSKEGLRFKIETAPESCFLPWPAVSALRLSGRTLRLEFQAGITPNTPGVTGLDQPAVRRALRRDAFGTGGLRFFIGTFRTSLEQIDLALYSFTDGRVRIG